MIGTRIGQYEILEKLGEGGMGEVYRARDGRLGRDVALKFLPADFAQDAERLERFEREARALAALNHPNIATIHGFEQVEELRFLVLEVVEGDDLATRVARGRIPVPEALRIMAQVAEAVETAHAHGIVHRDLKPANIKLTPEGKVKVLDFGLARVYEKREPSRESDLANSPTLRMGRTGEGVLLGTAPYMSPEQLKGETGDARSDIWSMGCVFYELLCGTSPFWADSLTEVAAKTLETEPDWRKLPGDLPAAARRLLRRCLVKDPQRRLHAAADIRIELVELLEGGEDDDASPASQGQAVRAGQFAVFALILVAAVTGTWMLRGGGGADRTADREPVRLMIPVRDRASVVPLPETSSVAISPNGRTVVYVVAETKRVQRSEGSGFGDTQLYRRKLDSFDAEPIPGTAGAVAPVFSPDGESIAYFNFNLGSIVRVPTYGGNAVPITSVPDVNIRGIHWAPDDRIYYSDMRSIWSIDADGGERELVAAPAEDSGVKTYRFPQLLPDGRSVLLTVGDYEILSYDEADIAILDLDSGELHTVVHGGSDARYLSTGHLVFGRAGRLHAGYLDLKTRSLREPAVPAIEGVVNSEGYGAVQMAWSETGSLVYVAGGSQQFSSEMMLLHRDGRIEELGQPMRPFGQAQISPQGDRVVFSVLGANASIWMLDLGRGISTRLVSGWDNYAPIFDRAGERIAHASNRSHRISIWVGAADGGGGAREVATWASNLFPNDWTADGHQILTTMFSPTTGMDVAICSLDGQLDPIVSSPAREFGGRFSPDDRYILYSSDESGSLEVYVQTYPVTGRKWRLSDAGGDLSVWSKEGDQIYFWRGHDLMRVAVTAEPDFRPSRAEHILTTEVEVSGFDVFPSGERFLVLGRRPSASGARGMMMRAIGEGRLFPAEAPDLRVVLNWFDELEKLVPTR